MDKPKIAITVRNENEEETAPLLLDDAYLDDTANGTVFIGYRALKDKTISLIDFLHALVNFKVLKPIVPEFAHLPSGIYTTLIKNAAIPLPKGSQGGEGVEGYWISLDPDDALEQITEALRGDAWSTQAIDVAGDLDSREENVKCLFRRVH